MLSSLSVKDKNELPLVSMISVFYNRGYCVKESVQSMLDQTYPNLEIILVDDESTDNTLEELRRFEFDSRVKIITHSNKGFTLSLKEAIEEFSNGEFISIHGSGDISLQDRIFNQIKFLTSFNHYALVACGRAIYRNNIQVLVNKKLEINKSHLIKLGNNPFSHGEVTFSRKAYNFVGGYRKEFKLAQDYDLWLRINKFYKLARLESVDYIEYSRGDGVKESIAKTLKQKKYSHLARVCNENHYELSTNEDENFFQLIGNRTVALSFLKTALYFLSIRKINFARKFIIQSKEIKTTLVCDLVNLFLVNKLGMIVLSNAKKIYKITGR